MFRKSRGKIREVEVEVLRPDDVDRPRRVRAGEVPKPELSPSALEAAAAPGPRPQPRGIEQLPAAEETVAARAAPPFGSTELRCEILFWRGYWKAAFYARIFNDEREPLAVAESPHFRSRGNGLPERTDDALLAYKELRDQLERDGWKHVTAGETWFGDTFAIRFTDAEEPAQG